MTGMHAPFLGALVIVVPVAAGQTPPAKSSPTPDEKQLIALGHR